MGPSRNSGVWDYCTPHFVPGVARTVTGELMYRTDSWDRPRRGETEQILGGARGFARGCVCSKPMEANAFRCQLAVLAQGPLTWLRLLCLEGSHASAEPRTLPLDFVRVAARRVTYGRRACFHFSIARASQGEFFRAVVGCDRISRELRVA